MDIRSKVIKRVISDFSGRFRVTDNTGSDKKIVAGEFPDVLIYKKDPPHDGDILFVLKVENGGELVDSVSQWKGLSKAPSTFYIVVPENKLADAKKLASATGINAKFAWYDEIKRNDTEITEIHYG